LSIELNRDNYQAETTGSKDTILIDFWGPLCKPCLALAPEVEQIEKDFNGRLKVGKVNASQNRMLCARLKVMSLPTFILYKNGAEAARLTGEQITVAEIRAAVKKVI
jgi:thioredoxin 1